jgi:MFS family permease
VNFSPPSPPPDGAAAAPAGRFAGITRNVLALGVVSLFNDISSEMLIPVLPLFVTGVLHASVASLGIIEGVGECTASALRILSGWVSDRSGSRKPFITVGYGLSGVAKGALAVAASWPAVMGLRFADRIGKGLRSPARDALIADSVEPRYRGRAFGLNRALDTLGAAIGPLVAFALLQRQPGNLRRVFSVSMIPAAITLLVLIVFVHAPRRPPGAARRSLLGEWRALDGPFRRFILTDAIFQLGNSSMAFVLLRLASKDVGFSAAQVTLVYLGFNLVYALLALPFGDWSDRVGRRPMLLASYALYAVVYALLAATASRTLACTAFLLYGVQSALMDGQQKSLLADLVPAEARATAFGVYYTVAGAALLPASIVAGLLWDRFGPRVTFGVDAALALLAAVLFVVLLPARHEMRDRHA